MPDFCVGDTVVLADHRKLLWDGEVLSVNTDGTLTIRWVATESMRGSSGYSPGDVVHSFEWRNLSSLLLVPKDTSRKSSVERKVIYLREKWRRKMKKKGMSYAHI